ncbi:hypothetical protein Moror_17310 [Moniliophthora roreri MCA 2997]|nr:hypothetical protein Moror_17310 [Moniliophthora roreri MCA 2997]
MQRIWTLQEGMLARELLFEVSDGFIDVTHLDSVIFTLSKELISLLRHRSGKTTATAKKLQDILPSPPHLVYNDLIPLLRYRKTSKPQDETSAVAGLLRIDASELVAESSAESRMRKLLLLCKHLPRIAAVHGRNTERIKLSRFTWAPASITNMFWMSDSSDAYMATCIKQGLYRTYSVIHFLTTTKDPTIMSVVETTMEDSSEASCRC